MACAKLVRNFAVPVQFLAASTLTVFLAIGIPVRAAAAGASPQVFAGTVVAADGKAVPGQRVGVYVAPNVTGKTVLIGTAVTASDGRWRLAAPAFAALPKAARQAAIADLGYLNVEAVAASGNAVAAATESAWVGTPALTTESSSSQPVAMRMRLRTAASAKSQVPCCDPRFGCGPPLVQAVLHRGHAYTVVGEYHAFWNASGGLRYTRGAASSIGSAQSFNDGPFSFSGFDTFTNSQSLTMGFPSNGPHNSHQMVVALKYEMRRFIIVSNRTGAVCLRWRQIDENGLYNPGHNFVVFKKGKSVLNSDGKARYRTALRKHPRFVNVVSPGGSFTLDRGKGRTYGVAASAFGVGIRAETTHSSDVAQIYMAGTSRRRKHHVWGNDGNLTSNPQVVSSY